ncbi:MAG: helix-turn-helix transcriptional regulator [Actinobacteria bacterium]|nr:helix-turn-helix transcriptional regulator [Actinomycetota bacterium]
MPDVRNEIDKRLADVGDFIRTQREVARMSVRRLAEVAGVSNPYLSQIERGLRKPSAEILQQIAKALQLSAETLYERAGFLAPDAGARGVREAIAADPLLSPEQQQALLNVYQSFVGQAPAAGGGRPKSPPR